MSSRVFTIAVGVLVVLVILTYMFSFQVRETEMAVKLTFGKASDKAITKPGLYVRWPWPIQSIVKYDRRLHVFDTRLEETLTSDKQNITVSLAVGWRIVDPIKFRESTLSAGDMTDVQNGIDAQVSDKASIIAIYKLENLVSIDEEDIRFQNIEGAMSKEISEVANRLYGVDVPLVRIRRLELPETGANAVFARMKQERRKESDRYRAEGRGAAAEIRARADSARDRILARASAEAAAVRAEGDAKAAEWYQVFKKNENLALFLRKVRGLKEVLSERSTIVLDTRTTPLDIFHEGPETSGAGAEESPLLSKKNGE